MATEKFHEYIYGATIEAETDHKPLISLHTKNLSELTPRLQRLMLCLRRYDLKLSYTPGKYLVLADALSRAYNKTNTESSTEREVAMHVNMIKENTLLVTRCGTRSLSILKKTLFYHKWSMP